MQEKEERRRSRIRQREYSGGSSLWLKRKCGKRERVTDGFEGDVFLLGEGGSGGGRGGKGGKKGFPGKCIMEDDLRKRKEGQFKLGGPLLQGGG